MRLHRLEICALGPFAGRQEVDLDRLSADGLFLLHGETGAGKTSVLDAVAYALFGVVPGSRQQAHRLRSDHAGPDLPTSVTLELTVAGQRVRVMRRPAWRRPKRRGTGTTEEPAGAVLERWEQGQWQAVSTRVDEVSHQLRDWVGMSADQFFQVVLLPQGDFARFLRAESADREALLERLFGTERFTAAQDWLADQRKQAAIAVEHHEGVARGLRHRLAQELGLVEPPSTTDAGWRAEQLRRCSAARDAAVTAQTAARQAHLDAQACARRAQRDAEQAQRRREVATEREAVLAARPALGSARDELEAARRAAVVHPLAVRVEAAEERRRSRQARRHSAVAGVSHRGLDPGAGPPRAVAADLRRARGRLDQALTDERLADQLARNLVIGKQEIDATEAEAAGLRAVWTGLPGLLERAGTALADAERARTLLPGLAAAASAAERARAAAQGAEGATSDLVRAEDALRAAVDADQAAAGVVLELRERRLGAMAAELAGGLRIGEPCPVCGSAQHPAPADPGLVVVGEADERRARQAQATARAARDQASADRESVASRLTRLQADSGGLPVDRLAGAAAEAGERHRAAAELAASVEQRRAEVDRAREDSETLRRRLSAVESALAGSCARVAAVQEQERALRARVSAARGDCVSVAARALRLDGQAGAVETLAEADEGLAAAQEALRQARDEAVTAALSSRFPDLGAARAAVRSDGQRATLQDRVEAGDAREAALAAKLADPGLPHPGDDADRLGPARAAEQAAETSLAGAVAARATAQRRAEEVQRLADRLADADVDAEPARREYEEVRALADLVAGAGQNTRRMTLRAYVLAARLADVAAAASLRLRQMSADRYTFAHSEHADSRRLRAGLGLVVVDDFTGQARSTKTLSGGETFLASLALALGLADVVTAESGGLRLDTMFIDEGFGSLDADTLDQVMSTLDELRAGGRVVGVVSHVEEMRTRIPSRLHVRKRRDGSQLEADIA